MPPSLCTLASIVLAASIAAPFQCPVKVDADHRVEEDPSEALYGLAEKFKADGNPGARVETLRYLMARYPSSRFAVTAKEDLEGMGDAGVKGKDR
jgi:hypothetical protein